MNTLPDFSVVYRRRRSAGTLSFWLTLTIWPTLSLWLWMC